MVIEIKKDDNADDVLKKLQYIDDEQQKKRAEELKPFFGVFKRNINPLNLQKQWRNEWE